MKIAANFKSKGPEGGKLARLMRLKRAADMGSGKRGAVKAEKKCKMWLKNGLRLRQKCEFMQKMGDRVLAFYRRTRDDEGRYDFDRQSDEMLKPVIAWHGSKVDACNTSARCKHEIAP